MEGLALEALARVRGAEPADFVGATDVAAVRHAGGVRVVVEARVTRRGAHDDVNEPGSMPPPACVSRLCAVVPWAGVGTPSAWLVAVYDLPDRAAPRERLLVASAGGGCGPDHDDVVHSTGFVAIPGAEPFVIVSRNACDGWHYGAPPGGARLPS